MHEIYNFLRSDKFLIRTNSCITFNRVQTVISFNYVFYKFLDPLTSKFSFPTFIRAHPFPLTSLRTRPSPQRHPKGRRSVHSGRRGPRAAGRPEEEVHLRGNCLLLQVVGRTDGRHEGQSEGGSYTFSVVLSEAFEYLKY